MTISKKIETIMASASFIRKMFEEGARLKAEHGAENVFDFSLGNPNLPPPPQFDEVVNKLMQDDRGGMMHGYMPQPGYPFVRDKVAAGVSREQGVQISGSEVIMTCGAAGALNVILKALLDPGDEVLSPAPCFVEYKFYADNHGGLFKTVGTRADFTLDIDAMADAIGSKTKVVLINSPHNPTGQIYNKESLDALGELLERKSRELGRTLYLISDEPYRKIVYDDVRVPSIFNSYKESIVATSYSKDLSLPGERIGFVAINPNASYSKDLIEGMTLTNRILGFVNAPALMQRAIAELQEESVDISIYEQRRKVFCEILDEAGLEYVMPKGAFYLFPKAPVADDVEFCRLLLEEKILAVPGRDFGTPGHIRLAFSVNEQVISAAADGFKRAVAKAKRECD